MNMKIVALSMATMLSTQMVSAETIATVDETVVGSKTKTANLSTGWNMISVGGYEAVSASKILGNSQYVSVVYYYDATKGAYVSYIPGKSTNEYSSIEPTHGIWVSAKKPFSLVFNTNTTVSTSSSSTSATSNSSSSSATATTTTNQVRIAKPVVGDCATIAQPYGADAVKILADNGYTSCAIAGGVLVINSRTADYNDGLKTYKMNELTQKQADLVAELLDLNQDGYIDDEAIYNQLKTRANDGTFMNIQSAANQTNEDTIIEKLMPYFGKDMGVKNSWLHSEYGDAEYTNQGGIAIASQSMMLEEAVHLWHMYGYAKAYPSVWGVSNDGCTSATSTAGCNWNQSTLTKLAWEAMTGTSNWYHHPENTTNNSGTEITGTCTNPSCAAIEFVKDLVVTYSNTRKADSSAASSGTKFPQTKTEATTRLLATEKGKAFKAILDDPKYNQIINGFKYSYNPQ